MKNNPKELISKIICSLFGIGYIPFSPGTFGSLAALLVYLLIPDEFKPMTAFILALIIFIISLPAIKVLENKFGDDPKFIVSDEAVGMWLALSNPYLRLDIMWIILLFLLFRLFDILKPFPINRINSRKGSFNVLADDIVAAIFAAIVHQFIFTLYNISGMMKYFFL